MSCSVAILGCLGLQFSIRVRTRVLSVKRKEPKGQVCTMLSLGCVGVREGEQIALQKEILYTLFPLPIQEKKEKEKNYNSKPFSCSHFFWGMQLRTAVSQSYPDNNNSYHIKG